MARVNIEHYRRLLANETDKQRRQTILRLLAEEEGQARESEPHGKAPQGPLAGGKPALAVDPFAPMGGVNVKPLPGFHLHPPLQNTPAGEDERVRAIIVDNGEFQVAVEGSARDRLPHAANLPAYRASALT